MDVLTRNSNEGRPRTAFVLSGGASIGPLQVGMLRALYERGVVPDLLVATSAGALNAIFIASRSLLGRARPGPIKALRERSAA